MRLFISIGIGLIGAMLAMPALAGNVVKTGQYQMEKGVKVYRAKPTVIISQNQRAYWEKKRRNDEAQAAQRAAAQELAAQVRSTEQSYERGYDKGFKAGQAQAEQSRPRRKYRSNRYNYGRRYVTAYHRPFYYGYR